MHGSEYGFEATDLLPRSPALSTVSVSQARIEVDM